MQAYTKTPAHLKPRTLIQDAAEQMPLAGTLVRRAIGMIADAAVLAALVFLPFATLGSETFRQWIWLWLTPVILYFPVLEGLWGVTVGKLVVGMCVVDRFGDPPGFGRAIVRTLARLIEANPFAFGGGPAGLAVMLTPRQQRIGDLLANTYVIRQSDFAHRPAPGVVIEKKSPKS